MATRTLTSCTNPAWADAAHTMITCMVEFKELPPGPYKFLASPNDVESHGPEIFSDLLAGKYGEIGAYVAPPARPRPQSTAKPTTVSEP